MPGTNSARSLTRILYVFAAVSALLWTIGLLPILHGHASPLYPYGPNFEDILVYKGRFTLFHTKAFFTSRKFSGFAYPAGCSVIYAALYATPNAITTYLLLAAAATFAALATTFAYLKRAAALSLFLPLLFLSFPFLFLIQRANVELILVLLVAFGILAYLRGLTYAAAILFGLAAACKLYPIFLLGLFLKRKRDIPAFAAGLVTAIVAMCAAISFAGPDFSTAAYGFFHGVDRFQDHYAVTVRSAEINWDHCFFSPVKYYSSEKSHTTRTAHEAVLRHRRHGRAFAVPPRPHHARAQSHPLPHRGDGLAPTRQLHLHTRPPLPARTASAHLHPHLKSPAHRVPRAPDSLVPLPATLRLAAACSNSRRPHPVPRPHGSYAPRSLRSLAIPGFPQLDS